MRITLDRNGLLNLSNGTGDIGSLRRLRELHWKGSIKLCIPAIAASERQRDGTTLDNYSKFEAFLVSLGLKDYEELVPMLYLDVCYVNHGLVTGPEMQHLERQIHEILFPKIEFQYAAYAAKVHHPTSPPLHRKWLNVKCDVQAMWGHIWHNADIFVTEDRNFHKATKKPRLEALGADRICTPSECVSLLSATKVRP
ncbi:MAG: hypothetical protein Q8Q00_02810 [Dehalococcoidia bacterium]|nr:hypothetical protein [Dehalococcoidia bacterium]